MVELHPAVIERYRADVERLADLMAAPANGKTGELIATIRRLSAAVVVRPRAAGGHEIEQRRTSSFRCHRSPAGKKSGSGGGT